MSLVLSESSSIDIPLLIFSTISATKAAWCADPELDIFRTTDGLSDIRFAESGYKLSEASAAFPGDEDNDIALIRDHWIQRHLSLRKDEYSQRRTLRCVSSVTLHSTLLDLEVL